MVHADLRKLRRKNHIGETGRRISETVVHRNVREARSHIPKHSIETGQQFWETVLKC